MAGEQGFARYVNEWGLEEGISQFRLDEPITVACTLKEAHLVKTNIVFESMKQKGRTFVFCPVHNDFVDISLKEESSNLQSGGL